MKFKNIFNTYLEYETYKKSKEFKHIIFTDDIISFCKDQHKIYYDHYNDASYYYIYWGSTLPTSDVNPKLNLSQSFIKYEMVNYGAGWYPIGESIDIYTNGHPYISDTFSNNRSAGENVQCNYVLIPKGLYLIDGFNIQLTSKDGDTLSNEAGFTKDGEIEIQGKIYNIYTNIEEYSILDCNIGTYFTLSYGK